MLQLSQYTKWSSFKISNTNFLALYDADGVHIVGPNFENFGKWNTIKNFNKKYKEEGGNLILL